MERIAAGESPRICFGLDNGPNNPNCPNCPHQVACEELMEHLAGRVDVDRVKFHLVPDVMAKRFGVDDVYRKDIDLVDIEKVYVFCHEWVFDRKPQGRVGQHTKRIIRRVEEAETSIKLFFLANMYGWQRASEAPFYSKLLTLAHAVKTVKTYAKACQHTYGVFNTTVLDKMMAGEGSFGWIEDKLFQSEIIAGSWIINYKLFSGGDMIQRFYEQNEEALSPYWLAIEPTYYQEIFYGHLERPDPNLSPLLRKHRWNVAHTMGQLKTVPTRGLHVFMARERIMPKAIEKVLSLRHRSTSDFRIVNAPVTSPTKFWARLAAAITQYECLNFVDKRPSAFDTLGIRSGH